MLSLAVLNEIPVSGLFTKIFLANTAPNTQENIRGLTSVNRDININKTNNKYINIT